MAYKKSGSGIKTSSQCKLNGMSKSLSRTHMPMPQGKMSGAHGVTNGGGKHKTLNNAEGSVGSRARSFDSGMEKSPNPISKGMKDTH